jgi:hypothetical protein
VEGQKSPLTCVFVDAQDNRSMQKTSVLFPEIVMRIYLVANDFTCSGPLRPGWPATGGRKENWDTYLYFEVKDPTIMLPLDPLLRYRWEEHNLVLTDNGAKP